MFRIENIEQGNIVPSVRKLKTSNRKISFFANGFGLFNVIFLLVCLSALLPYPLEAATQVDGEITSEFFSNGQRHLLVKEGFSTTFDGNKWHMRTSVLSTQPSIQPQLFCPPTQTMGSGGEDTYYLKMIPAGTNQDLEGWVEPGSIPSMAQSSPACLVWLAYCSGSYITNETNNVLKPVWIPSINENLNREGKCLMPVVFHRDPDAPEFLDQLCYLSDGRMDPCNPSHDRTNLFMPPWSEGFTQAVFKVANTIAIDGKNIPSIFSLEIYGLGPERISPKLVIRSKVRGVVTNILANVQLASWLPQVPTGQRVSIRDYRFTEVVTNYDTVRYAAIGQFYQRTNRAVVKAVHIHEVTKPTEGFVPAKNDVSIMRYVFFATVVLLPVILVLQWLIKRRNQNKKEDHENKKK